MLLILILIQCNFDVLELVHVFLCEHLELLYFLGFFKSYCMLFVELVLDVDEFIMEIDVVLLVVLEFGFGLLELFYGNIELIL
jgi:hypothetical protein